MAIGQKLNETLCGFIARQPLFFVATAAPEGRVNLSPKGLSSLKIMDERRIVWLSLSGSGNETAAHLAESDRMPLMFCAFAGEAMILRVYGHARVFHPRDREWPDLARLFLPMAGARQIFDLAIDLVQTSCGSGVPFMDFRAERGTAELLPFYEAMSEEGQRDYWRRKNTLSIDGKPTGIFPDAEGP
ncbi:pyridoxamine 5'-phosphate oxidase family protein [Taklimakanibacter lacteus]|uniref:pyridoxamine 5'-phosphate oxidase family protein n=1 Tax=Taklimakanibacter lacteus TaxID=2268456 RepID=UPI000E67371A